MAISMPNDPLVAIKFPLAWAFGRVPLTIAMLPSPYEGEGLGVRSAVQVS
jgi:hypothetical protein